MTLVKFPVRRYLPSLSPFFSQLYHIIGPVLMHVLEASGCLRHLTTGSLKFALYFLPCLLAIIKGSVTSTFSLNLLHLIPLKTSLQIISMFVNGLFLYIAFLLQINFNVPGIFIDTMTNYQVVVHLIWQYFKLSSFILFEIQFKIYISRNRRRCHSRTPSFSQLIFPQKMRTKVTSPTISEKQKQLSFQQN